MELDFWKQRWQQKQIGFHLNQVNPNLVRHWSCLNLSAGSQVFVPLCGKSVDMLWLQQQLHGVTGVECSPLAITEFFSENRLTYQHRTNFGFEIYSADKIELWLGDYFNLPQEVFGNVSAVYDRASLVALPQAMRMSYVEKLKFVLPKSAQVLLICMEYKQDQMSGPPFSVSEAEVEDLYGDRYSIRLIDETDILVTEPRFAERGLDYMREKVFHLSPFA